MKNKNAVILLIILVAIIATYFSIPYLQAKKIASLPHSMHNGYYYSSILDTSNGYAIFFKSKKDIREINKENFRSYCSVYGENSSKKLCEDRDMNLVITTQEKIVKDVPISDAFTKNTYEITITKSSHGRLYVVSKQAAGDGGGMSNSYSMIPVIASEGNQLTVNYGKNGGDNEKGELESIFLYVFQNLTGTYLDYDLTRGTVASSLLADPIVNIQKDMYRSTTQYKHCLNFQMEQPTLENVFIAEETGILNLFEKNTRTGKEESYQLNISTGKISKNGSGICPFVEE